MNTLTTVAGADVRVGDTLVLWWGRDTVTALRPYTGPLAELAGAQVATFARGSAMTVPNGAEFEVVNRMAVAA